LCSVCADSLNFRLDAFPGITDQLIVDLSGVIEA